MLEHTPQRTSEHPGVYAYRSQRRHQRRHARRPRHVETTPAGALLLGESIPSERVRGWADRADRQAAAATVSILLGVTTAMIVAGLTARLQGDFAGSRHVPSVVLAGAFLALAIGVRVPQRFALWLCSVAWRRFVLRGKSSALSEVLINPASADSSLQWVVLSVIALLTGISIALLPFSLAMEKAAYRWMCGHFLWSSIPLLVLQALLVFLVEVIPFTALGLSISCIHHVTCRFRQWDTRATGWLAVGVGGGIVLCAQLGSLTNPTDLILPAAALPTLLVSLICAMTGVPHHAGTENESAPDRFPLPTSSDRWPSLLRASLVAVGCVGACAIAIWSGYGPATAQHGFVLKAAMFASAGVGALVGSRPKRCGLRSIGGLGVACAAAGIVTAAATVGLAHSIVRAPAAVLPFACSSAAGIGFALAYGHQTLLHRVASRSAVGATILGRFFVGSALVILFAIPRIADTFAAPASLAMLAMLLLALGGALIIHEPDYSPRTRRVRLCAVLGAMAGMILIAIHPASPWQPCYVSPLDTVAEHGTAGAEALSVNTPRHNETQDR